MMQRLEDDAEERKQSDQGISMKGQKRDNLEQKRKWKVDID